MSIDAFIAIAWDVLKMGFAPIKRGFGYVKSSKSYADNLRQEVEKLDDETRSVRSTEGRARNNHHDIRAWVPKFLESAENASKQAKDLLREFEVASKTWCRGTIPDPICRYQFSRKAKSKTDDIKKLITGCEGQEISVIGPGAYAADLREEVENLENEAERVGFLETEATNNVRNFHGIFTTWKAKADKALKEAQDLLGDFERASKTCGNGTLPDACCDARCPDQFCTKAEAQIKVVRDLAQQCSDRFKELDDISCIPAPGNVVTAPNPAGRVQSPTATASVFSASTSIKAREDGLFESRALTIQKVMDALANTSNSVAGIYGMAGVGKSTLLVDIEKRIRKENSFDWVAKADVSENPDIKRIQGEIADDLSLSDIKDKESVSGRAKLLRERLEKEEREKKKVLIILDNLWDKLDLDKVGIPCGHDNKARGCKLLLTSRDERVLRREMRCESDSAFLLGELENEEAKRLFEKMVGSKVQFEMEPLAEEALRICAGLPFLILQIAKLFIHTSYSDCGDALKHIWSEETGKVITKTLQLSYDRISDEAKSLLRLCVAFGASEPPLEYLARYGFGLGIFQKVSSMQEARDKLHRLIHTLQATSLLLDGEEDADGFKIHDLAREFVASFASTDRPLLVLKDKNKWETALSEDKLKSCEAICFPFVDMEELPKELVCPELRIFLLFENNKCLEISDSYFNSMKNLTALILIGICLNRSPSPFQLLENLHSLCLEYCSVEDVAILGELKGLQILSLRYSDIQRLPKEIGQLTELRLLDLDNCSELHTIEAGVLGSLTKIEELYMQNSFGRWNALDQTPPTNARLIELNNMKKLRTLYVSISDPSAFPEDLDVEKLTKYGIRIGNVWQRSEYKGSMTLELNLGSTSDVQSICELSQEGFPKLQHLQVEDSPSVYYILRRPFLIAFKALETLLLKNMINLEKITNNNISSESFSSLRVVRVERCNKMEVLFPCSVVRELQQLKEIIVERCELIRGIVEANGDGGKFELPKLQVLKLRDLPNIVNFFTTGSSPSTSTSNDQVGTQIAFFNGQQVAFPKLESLDIIGCDNFGFMFFPSMVKSLVQLKKLSIRDCKKMEAIIMEEEGMAMETSETLAFPMLTNLSLGYLERLTCLSHGSQETRSQDRVKSRSIAFFNREVVFPSLENLYISCMDSIEIIWDNQVAADSFPKLKLLYVDQCNKLKCVWDKELHHQVKFQYLHFVSVSSCKSLTSLFPVSIARALMQLKELVIRECGIVDLIEKEEGVLVPRFDFPELTSLRLDHLTELKCLYTGAHTSYWPALRTLMLDGCNKVEILASQIENEMPHHKQPLFLIEKDAFPNLQEFKLGLCNRMELWHGDFHDEEFFCKIRVLELRHLSKESAISTSRFVESLTNLEKLVVWVSYLEEPSSNVDAMEGPSHEQKVILPFSRQIKHLKTLDVSHCNGLSSMFTPTIAENLVALTKLRIRNCRTLTEVLHDEEGEERREVTFSQLKCMELDGLIELRCFSPGRCALRFPLLDDVIVNGCPSMEFFSKGPIKAPKLERVLVPVHLQKFDGPTEYEHCWKENLNITIQNMFMATIAKAEFVQLFEFPELIGKWHNEHNPVSSSWQLETLVLDKCPSFINAIPSKLMLVLEKMTRLQVRDCQSLEEIFDLQGLEAVESTRVLPHLRNLDFINLPKLRQLWNKDLQGTMRFNSLSSLTLYKCSNLRHAFTPSMTWCLANLEYMEIRECDSMEGVIKEEERLGSAMEKITFPGLRELILKRLPNLTSFLMGKNHALDCPDVNHLTIAHCPKMRSLTWQPSMDTDHSIPSLFTPRVQFLGLEQLVLSHMDNLSKIWTDNRLETLTLDSLREVKTKNCERLENLFPHWVATSLTQLEKLRVESCRIEEIVANGDDTPHSNIAQALFPKLTSLVLHDMPRLKTFCPNLPTLNWSFLEELRVTHYDKVNMLSFAASMNKWSQRTHQQDLLDQEAHCSFERGFPNLKRLLLVEKDIQMIQDGKYPNDIFGKPRELTLACFHDEKAVFPTRFLLERFQNMESLEVFFSSFEEIFPNEGLVNEGKHPVLESLRELKLSKLHNLKRVWSGDYFALNILQSIKTLKVWDCPSLTTLFPVMTSFQNLKELVVANSSGLVHLGTALAVTNLVHLREMTIIGCEKMKEVVAKDENGEGKVISFGKLEELRLQNMPSLECFSSTTSCILRFPCLYYIEVEECPKMKIFSKGRLSTPQLSWGTLFRYNWEWKGDLNRAIQKLSA